MSEEPKALEKIDAWQRYDRLVWQTGISHAYIAAKLRISLRAHLWVARRVSHIIPIHNIIDTALIGSRVKWDRVYETSPDPLWPNSRDAGYGVDFN